MLHTWQGSALSTLAQLMGGRAGSSLDRLLCFHGLDLHRSHLRHDTERLCRACLLLHCDTGSLLLRFHIDTTFCCVSGWR